MRWTRIARSTVQRSVSDLSGTSDRRQIRFPIGAEIAKRPRQRF
jgi:hypothetical protein